MPEVIRTARLVSSIAIAIPERSAAVTLRRLAILTVSFWFLIAASLLLLGYVKGKYFDQLIAQAEATIKQATGNLEIVVDSSTNKMDERAIVKSIEIPGSRKVSYISTRHEKLMTAYYSEKQLIAVDQLDLREIVVRRDIFDPEHRLRVQIWFNTLGEQTQVAYFDDNGKRIGRDIIFPASTRGLGTY